LQGGTSLEPTDVRFVDYYYYESSGIDKLVGAEVLGGDRRFGMSRRSVTDKLCRDNATRSAVNAQDEIRGLELVIRTAVAAHDGRVNGHEIDTGAEHGALLRATVNRHQGAGRQRQGRPSRNSWDELQKTKGESHVFVDISYAEVYLRGAQFITARFG
jgi:hypothetical protein